MMRPGRELNIKIATEVFGYRVWKHQGKLTENAPKGDRPLRNYSNELEWAWEVAEKMKITLIPIVGGEWFAFVGSPNNEGWESPQAVLKFLEAGDFNNAGAALDQNAAFAICQAAIKTVEKQKIAAQMATDTNPTETLHIVPPQESNITH